MSELIQTEHLNAVGIIRLNRPEKLNALNLEIIQQFTLALKQFEENPAIKCIILESSHAKAFCAGGDMRHIRQLALDNNLVESENFFNAEYALNLLISQLHTPFISLIDGICMGGGVGLTVHGRYRVASEKSKFAMPECKLGFFPDVGGSFFLPRMRNNLGLYLALTGTLVLGLDSVKAGFATHFVSAEKIPALRAQLINNSQAPESTLAAFNETPDKGPLEQHLSDIDRVFGHNTLADIVAALTSIDSEWSGSTLQQISSASPMSIHVAWQLMQRGKTLDLASCLEAELATARLVVPHADFIEGSRAILVDKDHNPSWTTRSIF
jgi:enoyl-CoA hydratase